MCLKVVLQWHVLVHLSTCVRCEMEKTWIVLEEQNDQGLEMVQMRGLLHSGEAGATTSKLTTAMSDTYEKDQGTTMLSVASDQLPEYEIGEGMARHRSKSDQVKEKSATATQYASSGPPRLIGHDEDPFLGSVRAMESFDSNVTEECSRMYGKQMLQEFRKTQRVYCSGKRSSVICHERQPFDLPRYMCELRHIEISSSKATAENCTEPSKGTSVNWLTESKIITNLTSQDAPLKCTSSVNSKALLQQPYDTRNFYLWYGDWITLWETLAALEWEPKDVELFLIGEETDDTYPFVEAWSWAFQKKRHYGNFEQLFGGGVCFSHAVLVPHGGMSTTTFNGGRVGKVQCSSPTVMASALYLEALANTSHTTKSNGSKLVTLLLRRGTRAFDNDVIAEDAVRSVLPSGWTLRTFRPESHSLSEQLDIVAETKVLVGAHGAGLTHLMFLPPKARVVEIWCGDRDISNRQYANLETMSDNAAADGTEAFHYGEFRLSCQVDKEIVKQAIEAYEGIA
mmetsp:Transcript_15334/g.27335  ORF Transcript_15334/g.27335 Transcript_15334/m.27335 type:complete len:511 (+) Transcript_15334:59-1591(+)